jgi:hypothetical protein
MALSASSRIIVVIIIRGRQGGRGCGRGGGGGGPWRVQYLRKIHIVAVVERVVVGREKCVGVYVYNGLDVEMD